MSSSGYRYDVFISHAVEDKIPIANELCERLEKAGLQIWYSGKELSAGDSINATIHAGLEESRYGIVILSHSYISKTWPLREFYILLGREREGRKIILPVLYDITPEELALKDLTMADRFGIKADKGLDHVVDKLLKAMCQEPPSKKSNGRTKRSIMTTTAALLITLMVYGYYSVVNSDRHGLTDEAIHKDVQARIDNFQHKIDYQYLADLRNAGAEASEADTVNTLFSDFKNLKSYFRNEYELFNGYTTIRGRKNVEAALHLDLGSADPGNAYRFLSPAVYLTGKKPEVNYAFINTQPLRYKISTPEEAGEHIFTVAVTYENNIRFIGVNLSFVTSREETKYHRMLLLSFLPKETYVFEEHDGIWALAEVR
jgi:hypothetical protein